MFGPEERKLFEENKKIVEDLEEVKKVSEKHGTSLRNEDSEKLEKAKKQVSEVEKLLASAAYRKGLNARSNEKYGSEETFDDLYLIEENVLAELEILDSKMEELKKIQEEISKCDLTDREQRRESIEKTKEISKLSAEINAIEDENYWDELSAIKYAILKRKKSIALANIEKQIKKYDKLVKQLDVKDDNLSDEEKKKDQGYIDDLKNRLEKLSVRKEELKKMGVAAFAKSQEDNNETQSLINGSEESKNENKDQIEENENDEAQKLAHEFVEKYEIKDEPKKSLEDDMSDLDNEVEKEKNPDDIMEQLTSQPDTEKKNETLNDKVSDAINKVKNDLTPELKKTPKLIKNIDAWIMKNPKAIIGGLAAIAAVTVLIATGGAILPALGSAAANLGAAYVGYKGAFKK